MYAHTGLTSIRCECGWMIYTVRDTRCNKCRKIHRFDGVASEVPTDQRKEQRRKGVEEAVKARQRLIGWLKLLRSPQDVGIGDTANRLRQQRKKSPIWIASDAHDAVKRLLSQCSCSKTEAVTRLNREYPY